jgi:hypothetical protein
MYSRVCIYCITIAAIMHDGLNPVDEPHGGRSHGVPGEGGHHLLDLPHQQGGSAEGTGRKWKRKKNYGKDVEKKKEKKAKCKKEEWKEFMMGERKKEVRERLKQNDAFKEKEKIKAEDKKNMKIRR